jgi:hypothetical protein
MTEMVRGVAFPWCHEHPVRRSVIEQTISPHCALSDPSAVPMRSWRKPLPIKPPMPCLHRNICNNDNNANISMLPGSVAMPQRAEASGSFLISPPRQQRDTRITNPAAGFAFDRDGEDDDDESRGRS